MSYKMICCSTHRQCFCLTPGRWLSCLTISTKIILLSLLLCTKDTLPHISPKFIVISLLRPFRAPQWLIVQRLRVTDGRGWSCQNSGELKVFWFTSDSSPLPPLSRLRRQKRDDSSPKDWLISLEPDTGRRETLLPLFGSTVAHFKDAVWWEN